MVESVTNQPDRETFIRLPWKIYCGDRNWVPPLLMERRTFLDASRNPLFEVADVALFLARRVGELVGRIAVIEDRRYNTFHRVKVAGFGLFESVDDEAVAAALVEAAARWARARGLETLWGPVSLSTNDECGLLVEGFDDPPAVLMAYNPPYYERLLLGAGLAKARDLWSWAGDPSVMPERVAQTAGRVRSREGVCLRPVRLGRLDEDIERIRDLYNDAWAANWGFAPMTEREAAALGRHLARFGKERLVLIAEIGAQTVGFALTLPDWNQVLARLNGRLWPFGMLKALWYSRRITRARLVALGVRPTYRWRGIEAVLVHDTLAAVAALGYARAEVGWTLENNDAANHPIASCGWRRVKTYRLYQRSTAA